MSLLEKLKNTFFEEEYVEVDEPVNEPVAKKVDIKEEKQEIKPVINDYSVDINDTKQDEQVTESYSDMDLVKKGSKLPYFEDEDFVESSFNKKVVKEEKPKKIYGQEADQIHESIHIESKRNTPYNAPIKGRFQPTPIISPIYGVLDKNYRKEEVIDKKDKPSSYVSRRNADLDSIRKKAYGDVSIFGNETTSIEEEIKDDPLLYDMMVDDTKPVVDQVTMADAEEYFADLGLEYNIDYKDGRYEKATGRRVRSSVKTLDEKDTDDDSANLNDNLFDLVDSMYEDGE